MMIRRLLPVTVIVALLCVLVCAETRIKDVTRLAGEREHKLMGLGLVTGLAGTGDGGDFHAAIDALRNMLVRVRGLYAEATLVPRIKKAGNVAIVEVSCTLPAWHQTGDKLDVHVRSIGSAKSLAGGSLFVCPLQSPRPGDDSVYAVAEGSVSVGVNATTGTIIRGAIVEKVVSTSVIENGNIRFLLPKDRADFTNVSMIARAMNEHYARDVFSRGLGLKGRPEPIAFIRSASVVEVRIPEIYRQSPYSFIGQLEGISIGQPDSEARVIIDRKTNAVVSGLDVRVSPIMAVHGTVSLVVERTEGADALTLREVLSGLQGLQATGEDIVNLVKMLDEAGALHGKLEYR